MRLLFVYFFFWQPEQTEAVEQDEKMGGSHILWAHGLSSGIQKVFCKH